MTLGFVTAILPGLTLEEVLRFAAETDFDCVEVMRRPLGKAERRYAGVTHIDVTALSDFEVARIHNLCNATGVSISGLGYYPNLLSPDADEAEACEEHLRAVIQGAAKLGLTSVNTFSGRDWTKSIDENWERFEEVWRPLIRFAEEHEVRIGIENCPMLFTADEWPGGKNLAVSPAVWKRMFEAIPSLHFGLNFDPSHFIWQQMDYLKAMRDYRHKLFHVHAKDARVDKYRLDEVGILAHPLEYHTPKLPGLGEVNWGQFFSTLNEVGYDGPVCIEVEDWAYEQTLETRKAALSQSGRYLRQFLATR